MVSAYGYQFYLFSVQAAEIIEWYANLIQASIPLCCANYVVFQSQMYFAYKYEWEINFIVQPWFIG